MVGVFADITITAKSEAPKVYKEIVSPPADNGDRDGDDFEIGEEITFKITGSLPTNYENFDWYYYEFTDTMGKGLTLLYPFCPVQNFFIYLLTFHSWSPFMLSKNPQKVVLNVQPCFTPPLHTPILGVIFSGKRIRTNRSTRCNARVFRFVLIMP